MKKIERARYVSMPHNRACASPPPYDHNSLAGVAEMEWLLKRYKLSDAQHARLVHLSAKAAPPIYDDEKPPGGNAA
jgi:hypothetical protein